MCRSYFLFLNSFSALVLEFILFEYKNYLHFVRNKEKILYRPRFASFIAVDESYHFILRKKYSVTTKHLHHLLLIMLFVSDLCCSYDQTNDRCDLRVFI